MNPNSRRFVPFARRRGTRGFAAFVTALAGLVPLAVGLVVLPASGLTGPVIALAGIAATAFGIAHLVAVGGLIRGRRWAGHLVGYLAAIGIGVAAFGLLASLTGLDPFGPTSTLPAGVARAEGAGLLAWMIGLWLVATRFALRGFPADDVIRPMADRTFAH